MTTRRKKPTAAQTPTLKPQPHGGALLQGGLPGNRGGQPGRSGRPRNEIRDRLAVVVDERGVALLESVMRGAVPLQGVCEHCGHEGSGDAGLLAPTVDNMLRAADTAAKYALGERSEFSSDVVTANVDRMLAAAQALMTPEDFGVFCAQSDTIWNGDKRG